MTREWMPGTEPIIADNADDAAQQNVPEEIKTPTEEQMKQLGHHVVWRDVKTKESIVVLEVSKSEYQEIPTTIVVYRRIDGNKTNRHCTVEQFFDGRFIYCGA